MTVDKLLQKNKGDTTMNISKAWEGLGQWAGDCEKHGASRELRDLEAGGLEEMRWER